MPENAAPLHLAVALDGAGWHPAAWREPDADPAGLFDAPYWVRLVRQGNSFSAYRSSNGTSWTLQGTITVTMNTSVFVGLAVTSHNDGTLNSTHDVLLPPSVMSCFPRRASRRMFPVTNPAEGVTHYL